MREIFLSQTKKPTWKAQIATNLSSLSLYMCKEVAINSDKRLEKDGSLLKGTIDRCTRSTGAQRRLATFSPAKVLLGFLVDRVV